MFISDKFLDSVDQNSQLLFPCHCFVFTVFSQSTILSTQSESDFSVYPGRGLGISYGFHRGTFCDRGQKQIFPLGLVDVNIVRVKHVKRLQWQATSQIVKLWSSVVVRVTLHTLRSLKFQTDKEVHCVMIRGKFNLQRRSSINMVYDFRKVT